MLVNKRMTRGPVAVSPEASLADALRLTREHRIRHLPVVKDGELAGILSDRDIRLAMPSPLTVPDAERAEFLERTLVSQVMTADVITVGPYETVEDAAKLIIRSRVGCLPVVDAHGALLGILTETDILDAFVSVLTASGPASRLEVALPDRPGELARAVRVIGEEHRLNIASLMVSPGTEGGKRTAIVHVATIDPRDVIRSLEAAGYDVGWPSLEADLRKEMDG